MQLDHLHRDAEVLSLFAAIISKLREAMGKEVPRIFEAVFECTLQMITKNFEARLPGLYRSGCLMGLLFIICPSNAVLEAVCFNECPQQVVVKCQMQGSSSVP